ncbi:hypothetical protein BEN47_08715 [Hymenobacter lapidarius]|uniref:Thioredoxin domain-containing protein n=1 Tax=Hymenobacter lapidarius TaxID=1908237 RepID=A0A1G1TC45_9BACT|nr:TlpA disulfide reductase family protein [Hymenobacter lapidarius]OGX88418.1 hypothetical protein BEN47_08715 [Hymenobacter lapidarius]
MKIYPILALLLAATPLAQAQGPAKFTLKGTLAKVEGPAVVYLVRGGVQQGTKFDSAVVRNGTFEVRGTTAAPTRARLLLVRNGNKRRLYTFQADNTTFYLEKGTTVFTSADSLVHATVSGSPLSAQYRALAALQASTATRRQALWAEYGAASEEQRKSPVFQQQHDARLAAIKADAAQVVKAYIKANSNSLVSLDALMDLGGPVPQYAEIAPLFEQLGPAAKATPDGVAFAATLQGLKRVAIGAQAPEFTLFSPEGKPVSLASFRGKYVLVDFWAYWCGPCRRENPNVVKVYDEYKGRNFEILGVTLDTNQEKWLKAIKDDGLTWPQLADLKKGDKNEAVTSYSVRAVPQNFLVDPDGKIVATNLRGAELKAAVARFIP